ncbi:MAG: SixA phosphatase family protein [Bacteroidota bacterium]
MKTLYLVRHGKSSWENMSHQDYERPLLVKGIKRTRKVALFLKEKDICPDLIVSSHAQRAYETATIIAEKIQYPVEKIRIERGLYFSGPDAMENVIFSLDDSLEEVMLVGHNPDMTNLANVFLLNKIDYLPTTGVVCVRFDTGNWSDIFIAPKEVAFVIAPKTL